MNKNGLVDFKTFSIRVEPVFEWPSANPPPSTVENVSTFQMI